MRGKTCLVTGGTSGIGYETALGLARLGARVGIVGRDAARADHAAARIREETGAAIDVFRADLSGQAEIRRLAREVRARFPRLDVLVNNAGAIFSKPTLSADGIEKTWALDHLAYVQLSLELLDLLTASAPARIVNLASGSHKRGWIYADAPSPGFTFAGVKPYSRAKLGNMLFTYALARRLAGSGVTVNAVHPGVVASRIGASSGGPVGLAWRLFSPFMLSEAQGARTSLHVAAAPELEGVSGCYFIRCRDTPSSRRSRDHALQERVWASSLHQLGMADPFRSEVAEGGG